MSRRLAVISLASLALLAAPAAAALAAGDPLPTIRSVKPASLGIGDVLTISGSNFRPGRGKNIVVFKRDGSRAVFVRAAEATQTEIKVKVPAKLAPFLPHSKGVTRSARFRVRVLTTRLGIRFTGLAASPRILPGSTTTPPPPPPEAADCDRDGTPNKSETDDDNDLLTDDREGQLKTNPCLADTDEDGVEDGWEYFSALDLNSVAIPYPGKRPFPNPLFKDSEVDFDGDGLLAREEFAAWVKYGKHALPLNYSDGTQTTGGPLPAPIGDLAYFDIRVNAVLSDEEKDVDGDGLTNMDEAHGPMTSAWWGVWYKDEKAYYEVYAEPDWLDPDTDGDGVLDGADDQDHDDVPNVAERSRSRLMDPPYTSLFAPYTLAKRVQPFNPCLPNQTSRTCKSYTPSPSDAWPPFDGKAAPPAAVW